MNLELMIFEVAGATFSVPLEIVEEVVPSGQITEIPNSPPFLLGLTSVRGKVVGVIDASRRYGIGPSMSSHFMICRVRGNLTAVAIDRPVIAGQVPVREMGPEEMAIVLERTKVNEKFLKGGGFELLEAGEEGGELSATGIRFLGVDADLFVSAEMASKVGEV